MADSTRTTKPITVYSRYNCRFCDLTKEFLQANNVAFTEYNIEEDRTALNRVIELGAMGVPVIDVDGQIVVGFDKPRLAQLIGV